jgi:hypothetical protein
MTDASGGNAGPNPTDALDDDDEGPPPPERPVMSDRRRPPVRKPVPPPWPIPTARILWFASFALDAAAMLVAFLGRDAIEAQLEETLLRVAPTYDQTSIGSLVDGIYWASIAVLGIVVALEAVLLAFLLNRRGGVRWIQLAVLVLHAVAATAALAFLTVAEFGILVEALVLGGFVVAVVAWVFPLLPSAHRWFRTKGERHPAPAD